MEVDPASIPVGVPPIKLVVSPPNKDVSPSLAHEINRFCETFVRLKIDEDGFELVKALERCNLPSDPVTGDFSDCISAVLVKLYTI